MKKHFIVGIGLMLAIIAIGSFFHVLTVHGDNSPLTSSPASQDTGDKIVQALARLQSIRLSDSIFSDPGFSALIDFTQTVVPEAKGRANPFAQFGVVTDGDEGILSAPATAVTAPNKPTSPAVKPIPKKK